MRVGRGSTLPDQSVQIVVRQRAENVAVGQGVADLPLALLCRRASSGRTRCFWRDFVVRGAAPLGPPWHAALFAYPGGGRYAIEQASDRLALVSPATRLCIDLFLSCIWAGVEPQDGSARRALSR